MTLFVNASLAPGGLVALARARARGSTATERLASGLRINSARDDAAGLAIATRMTTQVTGLDVAARNALDAISLAQTAEGGLASIDNNLQRLRELAVQAANASNSASDRGAIQLEVVQLLDEIDRVARSTRFNGSALLDGSFANAAFQVGANAGQTINLSALASARTSALGVAGVAGPAPPTTTSVTGSTLTAASTITGAGQLVLNGVDVWQGSNVNADAKDLAAAINAAGISGLGASAAVNVAVGVCINGPASNGTFELNDGGVIGYSTGGSLDPFTAAFIIGTFTSAGYAPGLTSFNNGLGVTLSAADGRNIALNFTGGSPGLFGMGGITYGDGFDGITYSHVDLSYTGSAGLTIAGSKASALGLPPMTPALSSPAGSFVSQIDLGTVTGANSALTTLDAALATVAGQRAVLGAAQNRFAAAISMVQRGAGETRAARGRIIDADYADEAASLVRSQIVQQAGTAMVAQANAMRGDVLSLLRSGG
ncbi:MAG: flagellin [Pseudomonadota bacterium]|nr:flagellin [Pseudomonadota bacterium]